MTARTNNPRGNSMLMNRAMAKRLKDQPANVVSDSQPSYIDVVGNLAEDTVIAGSFDIAPGDFKVAMFANPFTGSEEMLYIDEQNTLRWARHVNPVAGEEPGGLSGWSIDPVAVDTVQVVVVVHPDGTVYAFTMAAPAPDRNFVSLYELTADPAVPGGVRWSKTDFPYQEFGGEPKSFLQVTYTNDRPATPVVFIDSPGGAVLWWVMPNYPMPPGTPSSHWLVDHMQYHPDDSTATAKVAGLDSINLEFSQGPKVSNVTMWTLIGQNNLFVTEYNPRTKELDRELVLLDVKQLVGPWTSPNHAGVVLVYQREGTPPIVMPTNRLTGGTGYPASQISLDTELEDLAVWQDAEGLLHIYGRDKDATLRVVHQTGWKTDTGVLPGGVFVPVFETAGDASQLAYQAIARPLIASVATFALDPYPDDMPDQHVMHQGADPGETSALYSQSVRTSFWHEERMRLVPEALPKPYVVPRYETTLTVRNSYGGAVGGCQVRLTADAPVDLEVEGRFYRTDTNTPVVLQTDMRGQLTLRVVARSLNVPHLTVTVPGMSQALTVQMAGDLHRFLAGTDTLPNHQDGFTPEVVQAATVPGGTTPLFPNLAKPEAGDATWPPTAEQLVTWCQGAFAVEAGTPLPPAMLEGLADGEEVCGFTMQARDPSRAGFEVFGSAAALAARRDALREQGVVDELSTWFGDVWQAIGDGVLDVAEATINLLDQTVELVIQLAEDVQALFVCAWDDIVSAAQAVEAAFVAVGAEIEKIIDWLKWVFNFADAFKTAKQIYGLVDAAPSLVKGVVTSIGTVVDNFFIDREQDVRTLFEHLKANVGASSIGSLQGATASVPSDGQPDPQTTSATDQLQGPHSSWFTDKVVGTPSGTSGTGAPASGDDPITTLFNEFITVFEDVADLEALPKAMDDLGQLFWNLFDGKDAASILATEAVTLLDLAENVIILVLEILDDIANGLLNWSTKAVDAVKTVFETSLEDVPLIATLWDFMLEEAGLDKNDYPFTLGMVASFFLAYPFTLIWKIVAEKEPFPDGIPLPPETGSGEVGDAVLSDGLLAFQAFQGVMQTIDGALDLYMNNYVLSGAGVDSISSQWKPSGLMLRVFTVGHFFAYVVGDHPWFWGYPPASDSHRVLPYVRYGPTFVLNMIDLLCAFQFETITEMFEPDDDDPAKEKKEAVFATTCFLAGWLRIGINIEEYRYLSDPSTGDDYDPTRPNWFDAWNLWINITAYIQTATGFIRYLGQHPVDYPLVDEIIWGALGVKNVVDVVGDVFSGVCTVIQPVRELVAPAEIQDKPANGGGLWFEDATLYQPYESTLVVQVDGGWPVYTWDALNRDDPTQDGWLPPGLRLDRLENTPLWVGDAVRISGIPVGYPPPGESRGFTLAVSDNYGPAATDSVPAEIVVLAPPAGVPTVSFTCSVTSGVVPLTVEFTNDTTDAFTEVRWDFGDGQTSTDAKPTITFSSAPSTPFTVVLACKNANGWGASSQAITVKPY